MFVATGDACASSGKEEGQSKRLFAQCCCFRFNLGVKQAVEHAAEDWGEAVTEVESMLQRLTSLMVDHACSGSAISQLMRLMTAGTLPSSLETFLVQAPGARLDTALV